MLINLKVTNIALIDKLDIDFKSGLTVLTGETGAGKSIIIDAINFVIGERADKTLIRNGESFAKVEAVFYLQSPKSTLEVFNDLGLEFDNTIILSRVMSTEGRNECRVNGQIVTVGMLKQISNTLIDIHGQQEHQVIMNAKNHLSILDLYAGSSLTDLKSQLHEGLELLNDINNKISKLGGNLTDRQNRLDYLQYQIDQLDKANLKVGEEDELTEQLKVLNNTERIKSSLTDCLNILENNSMNIISNINECERHISGITQFKQDYVSLSERLTSSRYELSDCADEIKNQISLMDFDQTEYDKLDARLDEIKSLKRKFNKSVEELINYLGELKTEYNDLLRSEELLLKANKQKQDIISSLQSTANALTEKRKKAALQFEKDLQGHLVELGMPSAQFKVSINTGSEDFETRITKYGQDIIEFMFSANLGQPLKPLVKVISGGEMSRFMLAFKNVISETDEIPTLIFDEIDTGISGNIAHTVAKKMAAISSSHQVISISHLPQIAAMADNHFLIHKYEQDTQTKTSIKLLNNNERILEVSRLLGGISNSDLSRSTAEELLNNCFNFKKQINN